MPEPGPRYRISRRLGQGGMAEVFAAEAVGDLGFTRKVAIKRMLPSAASDPRAAQRFLDEARIASHLHHGSIVAVLDVGLLDGLPFQVLELVDGIDAADLVHRAGGALPRDVAIAIALDLAHALDHAHHARDRDGHLLGIVHRDVKPANVLVSWSGDVKLADFGIALARDRAARTETGSVAGTLGYIAPEQRTRGEVDGRADVFALGLTLHALLTGYTPLRDVAAEMALLDGEPIALDPALPDDVKRVIARAVVPARLARPSAAAIATELAELLPRDGRAIVRAFVASLASPAPAPRGALDDLLGIVVEPEARDGARDEPEVHDEPVTRYRTIAAKTVALVPPRRRRAWIPLVAAIAFLGGGGAIAWRMRVPGTVPVDAAVTTAPDAALDGAPSDAASIDAGPSDAPVDAAPIDAAPIDAPRRVTRPDARVVTASARETGWMQVVGGEALVGAKVIVDGGAWTFFVPHKHEVSVGTHRVEVIARDGTKLPVRTIEVTASHTVRDVAKLAY